MKAKNILISLIATLAIASSLVVRAQDRPVYLTATTLHWNMDMKDFSMDDWKAIEKEYFGKVIRKNDFILTSNVLLHYFTADNSEIIFVFGYKSWDDIDKAEERNAELEKEAWPDEAQRKAFLKKEAAYYTHKHSDEIYSTLDGAKLFAEKPTEELVYYVRKMHMAFPEDGTTEEIQALRKEYLENVIDKNHYILAYYPSRHAWGSDGRDILEVFVVKDLGELEKSFDESQKLVKAHWPDENKRKEFFEKLGKYTTGWHGDYVYHQVPELTK